MQIVRALVGAKIRNHLALARAWPQPARQEDLETRLVNASKRIQDAKKVAEAFGVEGAAAAAWYEHFDARTPRHMTFTARVAPRARDPVNVLLNIGQTALHRQCLLALRQAGLLPTIGVFHVYRPGHPALASDLQEPYRHLIDRVVLEFLRECPKDAFAKDPQGPFALRIRWHEARRFQARIQEHLSRPCDARHRDGALSYREHLHADARHLKRVLLRQEDAFRPFEHP